MRMDKDFVVDDGLVDIGLVDVGLNITRNKKTKAGLARDRL